MTNSLIKIYISIDDTASKIDHVGYGSQMRYFDDNLYNS